MKIPLTREFLNSNLEQLSVSNIRYIKIDSIADRTARISIKTTLLVSLHLTVEVQEELDGKRLGLRMKITDGLGRIGQSVVDSLLPDGMSIMDDVAYINLRHFLFKDAEYQPFLDKITRAAIAGGNDRLFLEVELTL